MSSQLTRIAPAVALIAVVALLTHCLPDDSCAQTATCAPVQTDRDAAAKLDARTDSSVTLDASFGRTSTDGSPIERTADASAPTADGDDGAADRPPIGCTTGMTRKCADDPDSPALGNCGGGNETCTAGIWGACSVKPAAADACTAGDDANCNGTKNDGCPCVDDSKQSCGPASQLGECRKGTQTCVSSQWSGCLGAVAPKPRDCASALDNDCDGVADDRVDGVCACTIGVKQDCDVHTGKDGKGPCHPGTQICVASADHKASAFGACTGAVGPAAADTCEPDNDNNCTGIANEGCACVNGTTQACGPPSVVGICKRGTQACSASKWGACTGALFPVNRDCTSSADNDCNGTPDQSESSCECTAGAKRDCTTNLQGPCKPGKQTCVLATDKKSTSWGACAGLVSPGTKDKDGCNAGDDADCDGTPNEGCACVNGNTKGCGSDVGVCQQGTQTCVNSAWGSCDGQVSAGRRDCTKSGDNDCNGTDDKLESACTACSLGGSKACTVSGTKGPCTSGTQTCAASADKQSVAWGACTGPVAALKDGCSPQDDANCDGQVGGGCCDPALVCGGTCCPAPPPNATACNGSACGPKFIHPFSCNGVQRAGSWNFESNTAEGWTRINADPPLTFAVSSAHPHTLSKYAVSGSMNSGTISTAFDLMLKPCGGAPTNLVNRTLRASIYLDGSALPAHPDRRIMSVLTTNGAGVSSGTPLTPIPTDMYNRWAQVDFYFGSGPNNDFSAVESLFLEVSIETDFGAPLWNGTIYVDDIIIDP